MTRGRRAAVVGGSIGGLTVALLLRELGWEVEVFERSGAALQSRGAGIVVHPMAVRYVVERGVSDLDRVTVAADRLRYVDADGAVVFEEWSPYRFTGWNTLYRTLRGRLPSRGYRLGSAMVAFEELGDHVEVRFADGGRERCDLLVCADGPASTGRSQLLPEVVPLYSGYVGWRGTVTDAALTHSTLEQLRGSIVYHLMPGSHILIYPIPAVDGSMAPGHRLMNFVWYRNVAPGADLEALMTDREGSRRELSVPPGAVGEVHLAELRDAARRLPPALGEIVSKADEPFIQPVMDVEVTRMAFGRACLLGDAAFVARPHAAAGTAKAAADGWALRDALEAAGGDVPAALEAWETTQLALGRGLVARSREMGERSQFLGTWRPEDPSLRFGLEGPGR